MNSQEQEDIYGRDTFTSDQAALLGYFDLLNQLTNDRYVQSGQVYTQNLMITEDVPGPLLEEDQAQPQPALQLGGNRLIIEEERPRQGLAHEVATGADIVSLLDPPWPDRSSSEQRIQNFENVLDFEDTGLSKQQEHPMPLGTDNDPRQRERQAIGDGRVPDRDPLRMNTRSRGGLRNTEETDDERARSGPPRMNNRYLGRRHNYQIIHTRSRRVNGGRLQVQRSPTTNFIRRLHDRRKRRHARK